MTLCSFLTMRKSEDTERDSRMSRSKRGNIVFGGKVPRCVGETAGSLVMMVSRSCKMRGAIQYAGGASTEAARCNLELWRHL